MGNGTHLGKVRGLGSAQHGSHHWLQARLTALSNLLLVGFLVISLLRLPLGDFAAVHRWASQPMVALATERVVGADGRGETASGVAVPSPCSPSSDAISVSSTLEHTDNTTASSQSSPTT